MDATGSSDIKFPDKPKFINCIRVSFLLIGAITLSFCVLRLIISIADDAFSFLLLLPLCFAGFIGYAFIYAAVIDYKQECTMYELAQTDFEEYVRVKTEEVRRLQEKYKSNGNNDNFLNKKYIPWPDAVIDGRLESDVKSKMELYSEAVEEIKAEIADGDPTFVFQVTDLDLVLAAHGKLSEWRAKHGFDIRRPTGCLNEENFKKQVEDQHKTVRWIDKQLYDHGVYDRLYFSRGDWYYFPASEAESTECGSYRWGPSIQPNFRHKSKSTAVRHASESRERN